MGTMTMPEPGSELMVVATIAVVVLSKGRGKRVMVVVGSGVVFLFASTSRFANRGRRFGTPAWTPERSSAAAANPLQSSMFSNG